MGATDLGEAYYEQRKRELELRDKSKPAEPLPQVAPKESDKPPTRFERILNEDVDYTQKPTSSGVVAS
jgi:hypothetical protein